MDDDWFDELIALAPDDGVWVVDPDTPTFVICDRVSGHRIQGSPLFFLLEQAEEHIRNTLADAAPSLVISASTYRSHSANDLED